MNDEHRLRVTIQSLDPNCVGKYRSDWIEVFDSSHSTRFLRKKLCHESALKPFTSISNELFIRFESHTYSTMGYKLKIHKGIT